MSSGDTINDSFEEFDISYIVLRKPWTTFDIYPVAKAEVRSSQNTKISTKTDVSVQCPVPQGDRCATPDESLLKYGSYGNFSATIAL